MSEIALGYAGTVTPDPTLVTKFAGRAAILHGIDTCIAAVRDLYEDQHVPSFTCQGITQLSILGGASPETGDLLGSLGDASIGIGLSAGTGYLTSPPAVADRVSARLFANAGTTKGAIGALVVPRGLRPLVFPGRSTRAGGMGVEGMTDEVWEMAKEFASRNGWKCVEPQCLSDAQRAGVSVEGAYSSIRSIEDGGKLMKACKACKPLLDKVGVRSAK